MKFLCVGKGDLTEVGVLRRGRMSGTTLIELLVVIVVFLVGILAVVQIFPKGFQLLITSRNNSVATHLGDDEIERLKSTQDQIPEQIIAVHYVNGLAIADPQRDPYDLGPQGDSLDALGNMSLGGFAIGDWKHYSASNSFRRIIGEGNRVPSPRAVGSNYGGLRLLNFGPVDPISQIVAYANSLSKDAVLPANPQFVASQSVTVGGNAFAVDLFDSTDSLAPFQYFVTTASPQSPYLPYCLLLPTNSLFARTYHIRLSAYLSVGAASYTRQDYPDLSITVPATTALDSGNNTPPLIQIPIEKILQATSGALQGIQTFTSVEYGSVQVAPQYRQMPLNTAFDNDPFEFKVLDPNVGVLLFSPAGYSTYIERPGSPREPLEARVNYDVYDWRILRQDFRVDSQQGLNGGNYAQFRLALQSIKVGSSNGPDGRPNNGIPLFESAPLPPSQLSGPDNFVLIDKQTGGTVYEADPNSNQPLVVVNKSTGLVTVNGATGSPGVTGYLAIPGTPGATQIDLTGRALRVLYLGRNEWSVNVLKSADLYTLVSSAPPAEGQAFVPASGGTRIYFPKGDLHQKVVVDSIYYHRSGDPATQILEGQDFVIQFPSVPDGVGLPCIDITAADSSATGLALDNGAVARGIKGSSVIAQVLWNPGSFALGPDGAKNIAALDSWGHGWRRSRVQTSLQPQEIQ